MSHRARLDGLDGTPTRAGDTWRLPLTGGVNVRLGAMVVKDAHGHRLYRALPTIDRDELTLTVPGTVLAGADYPLTLDPTVGPEQPASDPVYGAADGSQSTSAVAWNGTNFFVVWSDSRRDSSDIYGSRVSAAGTVLDPAGIAISTANSSQPAVAWDGTNFMVVWQDYRPGATSDIYGARVSAAGTVLDPAGIPISTAANNQSSPGGGVERHRLPGGVGGLPRRASLPPTSTARG